MCYGLQLKLNTGQVEKKAGSDITLTLCAMEVKRTNTNKYHKLKKTATKNTKRPQRTNGRGVVYFSVLPPESIVGLLMYLCLQELLYTLRQRACTFAGQLLPGTNNRDPATKETANTWTQESARPEVTSSLKYSIDEH